MSHIDCTCAPIRRRARFSLRGHLDLLQQRRALLSLDQRLLDDIGLTRAEALEEAQRARWDVPQHWLR